MVSGVSLSILTLASRVLGLLREITKARFLGTSVYADAFAIAFMIPNLLRRLFAENSISVAFIPTFRDFLSRSDENAATETKAFVSATLTLVTFLTAIVVTIGIVFSPIIAPLFYKGDESEAIKEMILLTRIMFPYLFFISLAAFFQGVLNGVRIFAPSGFTPILFNAIVVGATYILSPHMENPARAMAVGVTAGGIVQAFFQLPFVLKTKWLTGLSSLKKTFTNKGTRRVCALIVPTIIGMAAYQLNDAVSTALAGNAETGTVSSLQYSLRLQELILGIFAVSIGTVILPDLSALAKKDKWNDFNEMLSKSMKIIALIALPVTFFSLICGREIISLIYKSNKFGEQSILMTLHAFRFHIAGLFFIALNRIVSPAFYAQGDTRSPTVAGIFGFFVNIALALALVSPFGGGGIALALSVASFMNTVALLFFLRRNKKINVKSVTTGTVLYAAKITIFSILAAIPTYFLRSLVLPRVSSFGKIVSQGVPLVLCALIFAIFGIALLFVTHDEILSVITEKVKNRKR